LGKIGGVEVKGKRAESRRLRGGEEAFQNELREKTDGWGGIGGGPRGV